MRDPLSAEIKVASFLMRAGGPSFSSVATQLGIGASAVGKAVREMSRAISARRKGAVRLRRGEEEIAKVMNGFEKIRGLPYCVGAVDGAHVRWAACPGEQRYERRRYKGYPSAVAFAVASADRRFLYADIGSPDVLGDSTIFDRSSLKSCIAGLDIAPMRVGDVLVWPCFLGDCAFCLGKRMMKSSSEAEMRANGALAGWNRAKPNAKAGRVRIWDIKAQISCSEARSEVSS